jgi:drug/metabolite transporter (DMT)-like permease
MTRRGALLFAAMCVIWGIPYLLIRVAVRELTPVTLVFARTGIAALLLLPIALMRDELRPLARRVLPLLAFTIIEIAVPWLLLSHAETRLTSSLTGLLIAAVPLVGAVVTTLGRATRRDPRRRRHRRPRRAGGSGFSGVRDRRRRGLLRGRPDRARALAE